MGGRALLLRDSGYATCEGRCSSAPRPPESGRWPGALLLRQAPQARGGRRIRGVQRPSANGDGAAQAGREQRFRTGAQSCATWVMCSPAHSTKLVGGCDGKISEETHPARNGSLLLRVSARADVGAAFWRNLRAGEVLASYELSFTGSHVSGSSPDDQSLSGTVGLPPGGCRRGTPPRPAHLQA